VLAAKPSVASTRPEKVVAHGRILHAQQLSMRRLAMQPSGGRKQCARKRGRWSRDLQQEQGVHMSHVRKRTKSPALPLGYLLVAQLCFAGCAAEEADPVDQIIGSNHEALSQYLVAEARLPGYSFNVYETEPGTLLELEVGQMDAARPQLGADLDAVQRYELITGELAPAALIAAVERAGSRAAIDEALAAEGHAEDEQFPGQPANVEKGYGVAPWEWFQYEFCRRTDRWFGSEWWTNDSSIRADVKYMKGGAFTHSGEISYRMGYAGGNIPDQWYGLPAGYYAGWRQTSIIRRQASSAVAYAAGDTYAHCVNYHY
jgi:hypothetical protein